MVCKTMKWLDMKVEPRRHELHPLVEPYVPPNLQVTKHLQEELLCGLNISRISTAVFGSTI